MGKDDIACTLRIVNNTKEPTKCVTVEFVWCKNRGADKIPEIKAPIKPDGGTRDIKFKIKYDDDLSGDRNFFGRTSGKSYTCRYKVIVDFEDNTRDQVVLRHCCTSFERNVNVGGLAATVGVPFYVLGPIGGLLGGLAGGWAVTAGMRIWDSRESTKGDNLTHKLKLSRCYENEAFVTTLNFSLTEQQLQNHQAIEIKKEADYAFGRGNFQAALLLYRQALKKATVEKTQLEIKRDIARTHAKIAEEKQNIIIEFERDLDHDRTDEMDRLLNDVILQYSEAVRWNDTSDNRNKLEATQKYKDAKNAFNEAVELLNKALSLKDDQLRKEKMTEVVVLFETAGDFIAEGFKSDRRLFADYAAIVKEQIELVGDTTHMLLVNEIEDMEGELQEEEELTDENINEFERRKEQTEKRERNEKVWEVFDELIDELKKDKNAQTLVESEGEYSDEEDKRWHLEKAFRGMPHGKAAALRKNRYRELRKRD